MRELTYCEALNEATIQEMERDPSVIVYGLGVPDHKAIFGSTKNIQNLFGNSRCFDMPLSEDGMMGFGIGASINGLKPVYIHIRVDFLLLAMNQLINIASTYNYTTGLNVPIVIRSVIGRGWGQGMQHSKSLQSMFAHIPGLKVVMPTSAQAAKGLLISAIRDPNPVIMLEHRWLFGVKGTVPQEPYELSLDKCVVRKEGKDLTIIATSWMNIEAKLAIDILEKQYGISVELIDVVSISPLDIEPMIKSASKTGRVIIADFDWLHCGISAEISSRIYDAVSHNLKTPIVRIGFANTPCPTARHLEDEFYPSAQTIVTSAENMLNLSGGHIIDPKMLYKYGNTFKGPF